MEIDDFIEGGFFGSSSFIVLVKLQPDEKDSKMKVDIKFPSRNFEKAFTALFAAPEENLDAYEKEIDEHIIKNVIDPIIGNKEASQEDKNALLSYLKAITNKGKPELEKLKEDIYVKLQLFDQYEYNINRMNKNQRISSSISNILKQAKLLISLSQAQLKNNDKLINGYIFYWKEAYRDFVKETTATTESIELRILKDVFNSFTKADISASEMLQKSSLIVGGEKYIISAYEPQQ